MGDWLYNLFYIIIILLFVVIALRVFYKSLDDKLNKQTISIRQSIKFENNELLNEINKIRHIENSKINKYSNIHPFSDELQSKCGSNVDEIIQPSYMSCDKLNKGSCDTSDKSCDKISDKLDMKIDDKSNDKLSKISSNTTNNKSNDKVDNKSNDTSSSKSIKKSDNKLNDEKNKNFTKKTYKELQNIAKQKNIKLSNNGKLLNKNDLINVLSNL